MIRLSVLASIPLGVIALCGYATAAAAQATTEQSAPSTSANAATAPADSSAAAPAATTNASAETDITPTSPGFVALKNDNIQEAYRWIAAEHTEKPTDPFAQLNLGTIYQRMGRMDLAEPLLRQAMASGRGVMPVAWSEDWQRGLSVDQIACRNLQLGLPAAPAAQAKECQPVLQVAMSGPGGTMIRQIGVYFDFDSAELTPEGQQVVAEIARLTQTAPGTRLRLEGKASTIGSPEYNMDLSRRRAEAVRSALASAGLASEQVEIAYTGESDLPVPTPDGVREPQNRVVQAQFGGNQVAGR